MAALKAAVRGRNASRAAMRAGPRPLPRSSSVACMFAQQIRPER